MAVTKATPKYRDQNKYELVKLQDDGSAESKTVFVKDKTTNKIIDAFGNPNDAARDYGADWGANVQTVNGIANDVVKEKGKYGFNYGEGKTFWLSKEPQAFQAFGTSDWGQINKKVTNVNPDDLEHLNINYQNTFDDVQSGTEDLGDFYQTAYKTKYDEAGLGEVKTKMSSLQEQINAKKKALDDSLAQVRTNPNQSAATITGKNREIQQVAGDEINNLIDQYNALGNTYNSGVEEVTRAINLEAEGKKVKLSGKGQQLEYLGGLIGGKETAAAQEQANALELEKFNWDKEQWASEVEIAVYNAETSRISATRPSGGGSGAADPPNLQQIKNRVQVGTDIYGEPVYEEKVVGYFNPDTGEPVYYDQNAGAATQPADDGNAALGSLARGIGNIINFFRK